MGSHVQDIKERLDVVQVIGSYIKLDKSGANYKARCPFHNEKTPSFYVSPERGSFYCFGCGAKGDIFTFVERFEGIDFMGSLKVLAERAGVKLERREASPEENRKETLYRILEEAASFFEANLAKDAAAKAYVAGRGLSEKTVEGFRVGFAPAEWRALRGHLRAKGFKDADVEAVGLIKRSDKPSQDPYYDVFRGRVMFPICDSSGRVLAFTGRTLDEEANPPKYLNSPETVLFSKSKVLFGLDKAKQEIRRRDYAVLVEGQMDCVMLHQAGFSNAVAASGTAFVDDAGDDSAFALLTRLSENLVIAFDSDAAGQKAVKRIVPAVSLGMNVKIIDIRGGKDPADIIKADPKQWAKMLESKKDFVEYLADAVADAKAPPAAVAKLVRDDIFPYVRAIPNDTPRFQAVRRIADRLALSEDALWKDLQEYVKRKAAEERGQSAGIAPEAPKRTRVERLESIERKILGIIHSKRYLNGDEAKKKELLSVIGEDRMREFEALSADDVAELTLEAEVTYGDMDVGTEYKVLLLNLEEEYINKRLAELTVRLHRAEKDKEGFEEIAREIDRFSKRKQEIKGLITAL